MLGATVREFAAEGEGAPRRYRSHRTKRRTPLPKPDLRYSCFMIRLPILKDELAFLEKLLPDLEARPDLGRVTVEITKRIGKLRQEIRALQQN